MIGRTLSHFRILAKIGEGGMGVVYKALDTKLNRQVAIKVLPGDLIADPERRLRFQREAQAAAALNHPNICTIHAVEQDDGTDFIVMELLEGTTLRERIGHRPMPLKTLLPIAVQVGEALTAAHERQVLHRDLKPDNILITQQDVVKVLDFGLAKLLAPAGEPRENDVAAGAEGAGAGSQDLHSHLETISRELTVQGKVFGTVAYMSPEQAKGVRVTHHSDLFSFGIVLYEMATGRQPFKGKTDAETLASIIKEEPPPPSAVAGEPQPELERIISKALEKDPLDRYHHADDMVTDLRRLKRATDSGVQAVRTPGAAVVIAPAGKWARLLPAGRKGRLVVATAGLAALLAAGGIVTWLGLRSRASHLRQGGLILVADFTNTTGRRDLDTPLRLAVEERLSRSSFVYPIAGEARSRLAEDHAGEASSAIGPDLAAALCRQGKCAAHVTGSVASQGEGFRLTIGVLPAGRARPLAEASATVRSEPDLLPAIHDAVLELRRSLGENPQAVSGTPPPTSRSLAAYEPFAMASILGLSQTLEGIPLLRRALEIDPRFTEACLKLSLLEWNIGDYREWRRLAREAVRLSAGQSEHIRLMSEINLLEATYDIENTLDRNKILIRLYPFNSFGIINIGLVLENFYQNVGASEDAYRKAYRVLPEDAAFGNLTDTLARQGKAAEIEEIVADFRRKGGSETSALVALALVPVARRDWRGLEAALRPLQDGPPEVKLFAAYARVGSMTDAGRLAEAGSASAAGWRMAVEQGDFGVLHRLGLQRAWLDLRRSGSAGPLPEEQLHLARNDLRFLRDLATFSADARLVEPLGRLIREQEANEKGNPARYVRETLQFVHACLDVARGDAGRASGALKPLARNSDLVDIHHVLGRACESQGDWQGAAQAYEDALRHDYSRFYLYSRGAWVLDQFRLAQVYERLGDPAHARQWYARFLTDWKDADPDIPELIQARARLTALGGSAPVYAPTPAAPRPPEPAPPASTAAQDAK